MVVGVSEGDADGLAEGDSEGDAEGLNVGGTLGISEMLISVGAKVHLLRGGLNLCLCFL